MNHIFHPSLIEDWRALLRDEQEFAARARRHRDELLSDTRNYAEVAAQHEARAEGLRALLRDADPEHEADYADPQDAPAGERDRALADFRALIALWEQHPQLPVPTYHSVHLGAREGLTPESVDELAALLGVQAVTSSSRHRRASVVLGRLYLELSAKLPPEPLPEAAEPSAQHVESDAERGICRNCGASVADGHCPNPQPAHAGAVA